MMGQLGRNLEIMRAVRPLLVTVMMAAAPRSWAVVQVALYKKAHGLPIHDPAREEQVLQKAAELGCARVIPLQTRYCVARVPKEKAGKKLERWNAISSEACEQSRRLSRMKVCAPITLDDLPQVKSDLNLIAYEHADHRAQRLSFALRQSPFASLSIMIGCEGGFAPEEVALSEQAGFACVSLGPRILRAETAAIAVLAQVGYELESRGME